MKTRRLTEFKCRDAACFKPSDRATVLACIRARWDTEEAFDDFVQHDLVEVFRQSKRAYQRKLASTAYSSFELAFGG